MADTSPQETKRLAAARLAAALTHPRAASVLADTDPRLSEYLHALHAEAERHGVYEILCGLRFARLLRRYEWDERKLRRVLRLGEGEWRKDKGGAWRHVRGGIRQPGNPAPRVYRWQPFQVFVLASVYAFRAWIPTGAEAGSRPLLPTEEVRDGRIWDLRRLCTDFTFFAPRKTNKTGLAAFIQVEFFLLEDYDAEIYCCANAADQAKILYSRARGFLRQLDDGARLRQTATVCDWRPAYQHLRHSSIRPLSAGGKTKDGMYAQLCCADEYGSAPWVKGHSDMKSLVDTIQSSMGPRREPLTFTTTTAGRIASGPFVEKLEALHRLLEGETGFDPAGTPDTDLADDRAMCLLLEPDLWERDEETLLTDLSVRGKVNPMLGIIVQHSFYDDYAARARRDPADLGEYCTKLFNVYKASTLQEWISPDTVRALQVPRRVDECTMAGGWLVFAGLDFSLGDDLHAVSYLCFNTRTKEFFADMDSWLTEHSLRHAAMREVFERWVAEGWLHVSPGETLDADLPIGRIAFLTEKRGVNFASFHYDTYKARQPINALSAWLYDFGRRQGASLDLRQVIIPCRQNYATFNPLVIELDALVKADPPLLHFSQNPMWPWQAGNMVLDISTDGMENRKPRKREAGGKIDNWICLLEALQGFDMADGRPYPAQ